MKKLLYTGVIVIILFLIPKIESKALVKYDDNKTYGMNDLEIVQIIEEKNKEQSEKNAEPIGNKQVDIIVFAGQDNMLGSGMDNEVSIESIWNSGYEMRFNSTNQVSGIRRISDSDSLKTTLIPSFINSYYNNTGAPVLAIDVTKKTSTINDWQEGAPKYNELKTKLAETVKYVTNNPQSFTLRNIYLVWYQGEANAYNQKEYEIKLTNFLKSVKSLGIKQNFMIRIGHLYRASGTSNDAEQRSNFNNYTQMIKLQTEFNRKSDLSVLVSVKAAVLSLVKGPSASGNGKISDMMINQVKFSQLGLDIIGSEAGKNAAYYVNTNQEPSILDLEYKDDEFEYYYTGYDNKQGLTDLQASFLYRKARRFIKEGNEAGILQYGTYAKQRAYQLELVNYESEFFNDKRILYMDSGFKSGKYLGLDCSAFASFIYYYTFGLPFDYTRHVPPADGTEGYALEGSPWTTREYLNNPTALESDTNKKISMFKYVGELRSMSRDYTLYSAVQKFVLRTGDLIIGKNSDTDAHIVIYIGKDGEGNHVVLNSTSVSQHNISNNGIRYHVDFAYLTPENFGGAANFSHEYEVVTVLRLNNGIMPENFIGNDFNVDFSSLQTNIQGYNFQGLYEEGTERPARETWLENHSVYISKKENQQ